MIKITVELTTGNMPKLFTDLNIMLKSHPDAKFEITNGESKFIKKSN